MWFRFICRVLLLFIYCCPIANSQTIIFKAIASVAKVFQCCSSLYIKKNNVRKKFIFLKVTKFKSLYDKYKLYLGNQMHLNLKRKLFYFNKIQTLIIAVLCIFLSCIRELNMLSFKHGSKKRYKITFSEFLMAYIYTAIENEHKT